MSANMRQRVILTKNAHEYKAWSQDAVVCGIDEVGRGCLAGPLVTSAVMLFPGKTSPLLKDSKLLTLEERLKAKTWITKKAWVGYGMVNHRVIDQHNIWQATLIAMKQAVLNLLATAPYRPQAILIDAMPLSLLDTAFADIPVYHFYKGEKFSSSIAAASIMAKIKRDELMDKMNLVIPGYFLNEHKGYSTQKHMNQIKALNKSIIHRNSFLKSILNFNGSVNQSEIESQASLFNENISYTLPDIDLIKPLILPHEYEK